MNYYFLDEIATRCSFFRILSLLYELLLRCVRILGCSNTRHELKFRFTMVLELTGRVESTGSKHITSLVFSLTFTVRGVSNKHCLLTFFISVAPSFLTIPEDVTILQGSRVQLFCNATGNPAPDISWTTSNSGKYWPFIFLLTL